MSLNLSAQEAGLAARTLPKYENADSKIANRAISHLMNPTPSSPTYSHQTHTNHPARMSTQFSGHQLAGDRRIGNSEMLGGAGGISNHSSQHYYGHGKAWSGIYAPETHGPFTPTYLRGSKYMEKLESAYKSKITIQRDAPSTHPSHLGSLSTSSSSVSLHKMAPSHRGMTYEIIERLPPPEENGVSPLPSKWGEVDKHGGLEIAADGLDVKYVGHTKMHDHEAVAARADQPMPPECGLYYFEVTIISKGKEG